MSLIVGGMEFMKKRSSKRLGSGKGDIYVRIRQIIENTRSSVARAINFEMVRSYWLIGKEIVEEEQKGKKRADYGRKLLENLSAKLTKDVGKGFDPSNLWNMRKFYLTFPILDAVRRELSWTHYRLLFRVDNEKTRRFYLEECAESHWSTRQLERQINSFYYERSLASKKDLLVRREADQISKQRSVSPEEQIKDPYVLEFLGLREMAHLRENQLERALIDQLQKFLLELGRGFSFVARQMRVSTETQHFFIDLVFYNYLLKCFVLIDLKTGRLTHQDIGQMDMYVRLFEDKVKPEGNNPTIGIVLCSEKDEIIVKYSVMEGNKKLFASKYKLYLPTERELAEELDREKQAVKLISKKQK